MSYLSDVKADIRKLVDALHAELGNVQNPEEQAEVFTAWSKELWEFVEAALKTSYVNGQKAGGGSKTESPLRRRFANWRERKDGAS